MNTNNGLLMDQAKESLRGKWGLAIGTCLIYFLILGTIQVIPKIGSFVGLLISGPLILGLATFSLSIVRNQEAKLEQLWQGFTNYGPSIGTYILMVIFIILWSLLLIIPGIIASISYSQAFYILADNPQISPMDAIDESKKMMDGHKAKYFGLMMRFFGLALLCILTLGIGFLWLSPYMHVTFALFYDDINPKNEKEFDLSDHLV
jgi:uncharacterized membrane protein